MSSGYVYKSQLGFYDIIWKLFWYEIIQDLLCICWWLDISILPCWQGTHVCHLFDFPSLIIELSTVILFFISYDVKDCHCVWWTLFISGVICNCNAIWTLMFDVWTSTLIIGLYISLWCVFPFTVYWTMCCWFYIWISFILPYLMYDC